MLTRCLRRTLSLCLLAFVGVVHAEPVSALQAAEGKTLESTARQRQYLDRRPYHVDVFNDLCERAMGQGGLDPLLEHYRARKAQDATDRAAAVLLTRLLVRRGELQAAREAGRELDGDGVAGRLLIGDLELRLGEVERAAELFESALQASPRLDDRRRVLRRLCELALDSGDEQQLLKRAESLGALDSADYPLQVEAAQLLLQGELLEAAAQAYRVALELVPDDVPRRTQTLADLGACHQRLFEGDQALAYYREALGLLRGDHWLAQELAERRLVLHTTAGTLEVLAQALNDEGAQPNSGAGPLLTLARLEESRNRLPQALEALRLASERAPRNERVSELLIGVAERAGKALEVQAELERRLSLEPDSPGLLLRLADSLGRAGESAGARTRLVQASRLAQGQAAWAAQLAGAWVRLEDPQRAAQVLDSALAQEPSPTLVLERARLAAETGSADGKAEALAILARGKPEEAAFMLTFAELHWDLGDLGGALALLEQAAQLDANSPTPLLAHAELLIGADRFGSARPLLRAAVARAQGETRLDILRQLQRLFGSHEELRAWCEQEARLWEADSDEPLPLLIQAR
ncbi:MAG: tetratricopeptide (TPR) repeat protein, partial [Planctomycetota bacterium]